MKANIWKFYLITALGIRFIAPIRILYLLSFGLNYADIGLMELSASLAIIFLEIPSGIFADLYGRKTSRIIAYVFSIVGFTLMSFGSSLPIFIFGWICSGIADAFQSGAQDALIFDTFKQLDREKDYIKTKSHFVLINAISVMVGSILGSYLFTIDKRLPWYLITSTIAISFLVFITIKEPKYTRYTSNLKDKIFEFRKTLLKGISNIKVIRLFTFTLLLSIPMYVFVTLLNQPYLLSRGFEVKSLGYIFALITLVSGLFATFSHKYEKVLKEKMSLLIVIVGISVSFMSMGIIKTSLSLALVVFFYMIDNFKNVILDNYLNESVESESRATMLSIQSFLNNIFISLIFVFIGSLADIFSINFVLIFLGSIVLFLGIPLWLFTSKKVTW